MKLGTRSLMILLVKAATTPLCTDPSLKCDAVELQKYVGDWFEIGNTLIIRNTFQRGCECTKANYKLLSESTVQVTNSCVQNGKITNVVGSAEQISNSEYRVSFPRRSMFLSDDPNYILKNVWVDEKGGYHHALVVSPQYQIPLGKYFELIWILARTAILSDSDIEDALDYARQAGYHPESSKWQKTEQLSCRKVLFYIAHGQ